MKRKLLLTALAAICTVSSAIGLSACAKHEHDFSGEWEKDATNHWHECLGEDCDEVADSAAHTYGNWTVTTTATEERDGERKRECTVCGYEQTETISKLQHTHKFADGWTKDETGHWHAATCEHTTEKDGFAAHAYGLWIEVTPATEEAKGSEKRVCSVCEYEETREIAQLDHTHSYKTEWAYDNSNHWHACNKADCPSVSDSAAHTLTETVTSPATIDAAGSKKIECTVCDYEKTETIPMLASTVYGVTVLGAGNRPLEGVTVKLGKYSAETDEDGVASVKAETGSYTVVLEGLDDGLRYDDTVTLSADESQTTIWAVAPSARGGSSEDRAVPARAGVFAITLSAIEDEFMPGSYYIAEQWFRLNAADGAKRYTVTVLCTHALIASNESGVEWLNEKGASYSVVVEQGESTLFSLSCTDEETPQGFTRTVFFRIEEEQAPAVGGFERPIRAVDGSNGKPVAGADERVYFRLSGAQFGKYAKVTFGEGVTVYNLGLSKSGDGKAIQSGTVLKLSLYDGIYNFLYAVSTGENCNITLETAYIDGMKEQPITAKTDGTANEVVFDFAEGTFEQWFKVVSAEDATLIIKTSNTTAKIEVYEDVNGEVTATSGAGSAVILFLTANQPLYIKATDVENKNFTFTCGEATEADLGTSAQQPLELKEDENIVNFAQGNGAFTYYTYTAAADANVKLTFTYTVNNNESVWLEIFNNPDFAQVTDTVKVRLADCRSWDNPFTFIAEKDTTYYIKINGNGATRNNIIFASEALTTPRGYEVTVKLPDGTGAEGVTVKLMQGETVAGSAVTVEGKATFSLVPEKYTVVLEGVPAGYGYYGIDPVLNIALSDNEKTQVTVTLTAEVEYKVTVKLPDGTPAEGVKVTFTKDVTIDTDAEGVAKVTMLPSASLVSGKLIIGDYYAKVEVVGELAENYAYTGSGIFLSATESEKEVSLTEVKTYTLTLTYKDGEQTKFVEAGTQVIIWHYYNGGEVIDATVTVGENGVATFKARQDNYYEIKLDNDYVTTYQITAKPADFNIAVTCCKIQGKLVNGVAKANAFANETALELGKNTAYGNLSSVYLKFVADKEGIYTIAVSPMSMDSNCYISFMWKDGDTNTYIMRFNKSYSTYDNTIITLNEEDKATESNAYGYKKVQIKLTAGQEIVFNCSKYGYSCVDIAYSEAQ